MLLRRLLALLFILSSLSVSCGAIPEWPRVASKEELESAASQTALAIALTENPPPTPTETPTPEPTATATFTPSPTPVPMVWLSPALPEGFRAGLQLPAGWQMVDASESATLRLGMGGGRVVATWVYVLVTPFITTVDGVTGEDVVRRWSGGLGGRFISLPLMMDQNTLEVFTGKFGPPAEGAVRVIPGDQLADAAWTSRPAWAIVPFDAVEPRWKVLEVDGRSPLRRDFSPEEYLLTIPISLDGDSSAMESAAAASVIPPGNRDPAKMTTLVMTGVTALVRGTAWLMEQYGVVYPAQDIGGILNAADITHISNEVPFAKDCPYPDPSPGMRPFCSDTRYIKLLESVGTDVVELTGNHMMDWGPDPILFTLDLYRQRNWQYFGGGSNLTDSRTPAVFTHNGNRLAFLGCDAVVDDHAWATDSTPGAAPCDLEYFKGAVGQLREGGLLPIMTFQYYESYGVVPLVEQKRDFLAMADAGAVIVSGSQSHVPQSFSLRNGTLIHYGLGNLFFDQYYIGENTRTAFVDRHVFYDGRFLGTELLTIVFVDNARPRLMTAEEREAFLQTVFSSYLW